LSIYPPHLVSLTDLT